MYIMAKKGNKTVYKCLLGIECEFMKIIDVPKFGTGNRKYPWVHRTFAHYTALERHIQ